MPASAAPNRLESPGLRRVAWAVTALLVLAEIGYVAYVLLHFGEARGSLAADYQFYVDHARRWLQTGQFYLPYQLTGPYTIQQGVEVLYPPTALLLFVPFVVLPAVLWWAIPVGLTAVALVRLRPIALVWPVMAFCLIPMTEQYWAGNTGIWLVAALMCGGVWGWPSVVFLLKPTLGPFALLGIWRRSWWIALGVLVAISLPFGAMWLDYATVSMNSAGDLASDVHYSLYEIPAFLFCVTAWVGSPSGPFLRAERAMPRFARGA